MSSLSEDAWCQTYWTWLFMLSYIIWQWTCHWKVWPTLKWFPLVPLIYLYRVIHLLKETYSFRSPAGKRQSSWNLWGPYRQLHWSKSLSITRSTLCAQQQQQPHETLVTGKDFANRSKQETTRMCRLLKLLQQYVGDYDCEFQMREERTLFCLVKVHR